MSNDHYPTDDWLLACFDDWFDPCPLTERPDFDGLTADWHDKTFCNPPYSNPLPWVEKAIAEAEWEKTVVMLLKHDSSTRWWALLKEHGARFLPIMGRLRHGTNHAAPFPSVLVVL